MNFLLYQRICLEIWSAQHPIAYYKLCNDVAQRLQMLVGKATFYN